MTEPGRLGCPKRNTAASAAPLYQSAAAPCPSHRSVAAAAGNAASHAASHASVNSWLCLQGSLQNAAASLTGRRGPQLLVPVHEAAGLLEAPQLPPPHQKAWAAASCPSRQSGGPWGHQAPAGPPRPHPPATQWPPCFVKRAASGVWLTTAALLSACSTEPAETPGPQRCAQPMRRECPQSMRCGCRTHRGLQDEVVWLEGVGALLPQQPLLVVGHLPMGGCMGVRTSWKAVQHCRAKFNLRGNCCRLAATARTAAGRHCSSEHGSTAP